MGKKKTLEMTQNPSNSTKKVSGMSNFNFENRFDFVSYSWIYDVRKIEPVTLECKFWKSTWFFFLPIDNLMIELNTSKIVSIDIWTVRIEKAKSVFKIRPVRRCETS